MTNRHLVEHEFLETFEPNYYCNYPEITKSNRSLFYSEEEQSVSDDSSSSGLSCNTSAVSEPESHLNVTFSKKKSPSLTNFFKQSDKDSTDESEVQSCGEEKEEVEKTFCPKNPKHFENILSGVDPSGWIKYSSDTDPWNEKLYTQIADKQFVFRDGILTHEEISKLTSNLAQLPDSKAFVFSRLHINKMDLSDISVLSKYRYFMYIDMSWNLITDLNALNNCDYLMYLNVSHNKITKVMDFKPPWFLTHANLSCNEIKEIGENLSEFWSLRYLDLSHNLIEKIEGLGGLKYLNHLNLSHNFIKQIENLHCSNLKELNLSCNKITGCDIQDSSLKELRKLNLAHNFLTSLQPFGALPLLKTLNASDNKISEFHEIENIEKFISLKYLRMLGNSICSRAGYREFLIFKLPTLDILDSVSVDFSERVGAKLLWKTNIFSKTFHWRAKTELWNQLAAETIDSTTVPFDEAQIPLVVLVGTFENGKDKVAETLEHKYPDQLYRFRKITTMPTSIDNCRDSLVTVSLDYFNNMIKNGKMLFYYKEIGCLFGVVLDELTNCVAQSKIGIVETNLEGAFVLRTSQCHPYLVLCIMENTDNYTEKLNTFFAESGLWNCFRPSTIRRSITDVNQIYESFCGEGSTYKSNLTSSAYSACTSSFRVMSHQSLPFSEVKDPGEHQKVGSNWSHSTEAKITSQQSGSVNEDDYFEWTWTYEPSVVEEVEPSESYLTMLQAEKMFVKNALNKQETYLDLHIANPSYFKDVVFTDDVNLAVKKVGKICCEIFNKWRTLNATRVNTFMKSAACQKIVEDKVKSLIKDLTNVPSGI